MEQETQYCYATVGNQTTIDDYGKQSFQAKLEQNSSLVRSWIKKKIPLADFAISRLGWSIAEDKSTKRDLVLDHPTHGRIIVPTRPKSFNRLGAIISLIGREVEH
jgi:hypothetical protein